MNTSWDFKCLTQYDTQSVSRGAKGFLSLKSSSTKQCCRKRDLKTFSLGYWKLQKNWQLWKMLVQEGGTRSSSKPVVRMYSSKTRISKLC